MTQARVNKPLVPLQPTLNSLWFPRQVAIIAGNFELAEYIKNHKETDVGEWARRGWLWLREARLPSRSLRAQGRA